MNATRTQDRAAVKPWIVDKIRDRGRREYYRFHVQGYNLWTGESFSWSVPNLDSPNYDLSVAVAS